MLREASLEGTGMQRSVVNLIGSARALFSIVALLFLLPASAVANPTLSVSQPGVTVETGRLTSVLLSVDAMPAKAYLYVDGDPGIAWSLRPAAPSQWVLRVGPKATLTADATLTIQLLDAGNKPIAVTQVKVTPKALPAPDSVAALTLMLDGGGLVEGLKSRAYLVVTNKSEHAIALRRVDPVASDGIVVTIDAASPLIMPRETVVQPMTIEVERGRVPRTGTHQLAVRATLTTDLTPAEARLARGSIGAPRWEARVVASKEVELTVPGLSELQGILQIPTLLLLPGLLAMIAFTALLDLAKPRPVGENPLSRLTIALSPGVWVIMIMVSAVIDAAYALLAGRDILFGFGLRDLATLWFASLIVGGLVGWRAYCVEIARQRAAAAPRFANGITPSVFLQQMAREGEPIRRRARLLGEQLLFDLGAVDAANQLWACGVIVMRPTATGGSQVLDAVRSAADDAARIVVVVGLVQQGKLTLEWRPFIVGAVRVAEPQIVSTDLFVDVLRDDTILQEGV
ncbi:hypothetical protein [Sphingomonas sp. ERG5]|uniref:hypothetical protein n=1 Tax=Sphingomonas sp. ERG5 TaxID=1381597 RepID=UPI001364D479|nr:hypothetical protein [Sphingomonas sp. ERG5]